MTYEPEGIRFLDRSGEMLWCTDGDYDGWLCRRGAEGQWVTVRESTLDDCAAMADIVTEEQAHHILRRIRAVILERERVNPSGTVGPGLRSEFLSAWEDE